MTKNRSTIRRRRSIYILTLALATIGLVVGRGVYQRYYGDPNRFAVVKQGVLYRSGQPRRAQIKHLIEEIGLRTIIIARSGHSQVIPDEIALAKELGIHAIQIPIKGRQQIPEKQIEAFFRIVDDPTHQPVLVHCSAGRHRTGFLCALYRIERQGWSVDRAVEEMRSFDPKIEPQRSELLQLKQYKPGSFAQRQQKTSSKTEPNLIASP